MKKTKYQSKALLIIALGFIGFLILFFVKINLFQDKYYESKTLQLSISIPSRLNPEEKFTTLILKSDNGEIFLSRNGTNYDNLEGYISDLDSKRNIVVTEKQSLLINNYEAISRISEFSNPNIKQKSYYIYVNNWAYVFSTNSEVLYGDLDRIARSFKYTGE